VPTSVPKITSQRLDLVSLSPAILAALLDGHRAQASELIGATLPGEWPTEQTLPFLRLRREEMEREPDCAKWLVRAIVLRDASEMIGHCGFHGPPGLNAPGRPGALELGYAIFADYRNQGYATEAVAALMEWARAEHEVTGFVASIEPDNAPSLTIVRKLGFVQTGDHWDEEDGLELEFELTFQRA